MRAYPPAHLAHLGWQRRPAYLFLSLLLLFGLTAESRAATRIGLMLQGPGTALYSRFGHIGLVLEDDDPQLPQQLAQAGYPWDFPFHQILFDFGNMNFDDRNFVPNVVRGQMYYSGLAKPFQYIVRYNSQQEKRQLRVLWLNLSPTEAQAVKQQLLQMVAPPQNVYLYDYYFRNCATYPRDIIDLAFAGELRRQTEILPAANFRTLVHQALYLHFWSDLLLFYLQGPMLDQPRNLWEAMFMPEYLGVGLLASRRQNGEAMVDKIDWIYRNPDENFPPVTSNNLPALLVGLAIGALLTLVSLWARYRPHPGRLRLLALLGSLVCFFPLIPVMVVFIASFYYPMNIPQNNLNLLAASPLLLLSFYACLRLLGRRPAEVYWRLLRLVARVHLLALLLNALLWIWPGILQRNSQIWLLFAPIHLALACCYPTPGSRKKMIHVKGS